MLCAILNLNHQKSRSPVVEGRMSDCIAIVRGIPHIPSVTEVNVRSGPGTNFSLAFTVPVGMDSLKLLDVQPDSESKDKDGKIYQWFKITFHGGAVGWIRDDLIDLIGPCGDFGYDNYASRTFAFPVTRSVPDSQPPVEPEPLPTPSDHNASFDPFDLERIRRSAFAITQVFEGRGYPAFQNFDRGLVSYGRFQFTLAAGSLGTVVKRFTDRSLTMVADSLRRDYLPRVIARDAALQHDTRFRDLLISAADEQVMRAVQNEVATEGFWNRMLDLSARPRGIKLPLSLALLFDISINFGVQHGLITRAEDELNIPQRSVVGQHGVSEQQLMAQVADVRKRSHDRQADNEGLPGLKVRGDFWVNLTVNNDWNLIGDANGDILVKGARVQVRAPDEM
jgi:hypothetical protein